MTRINIWDAGEKHKERYTILFGNKVYIVSCNPNDLLSLTTLNAEDIEVRSVFEIDLKWMDDNQKSITVKDLPVEVVNAVKARIQAKC